MMQNFLRLKWRWDSYHDPFPKIQGAFYSSTYHDIKDRFIENSRGWYLVWSLKIIMWGSLTDQILNLPFNNYEFEPLHNHWKLTWLLILDFIILVKIHLNGLEHILIIKKNCWKPEEGAKGLRKKISLKQKKKKVYSAIYFYFMC